MQFVRILVKRITQMINKIGISNSFDIMGSMYCWEEMSTEVSMLAC